MNRITVRISVFGLIGVAANSLIVWRVAYAPPEFPASSRNLLWSYEAGDQQWFSGVHIHVGRTRINSFIVPRGEQLIGYEVTNGPPPDLPPWSAVRDPAIDVRDGHHVKVHEWAIGWPLRAARSARVTVYDANGVANASLYVAWGEHASGSTSLPVPLIPIWSGGRKHSSLRAARVGCMVHAHAFSQVASTQTRAVRSVRLSDRRVACVHRVREGGQSGKSECTSTSSALARRRSILTVVASGRLSILETSD